MTTPLSSQAHLRLAVAVLLCILCLAAGGDPMVGEGRSAIGFGIAFVYACWTLVAELRGPSPE